jgi:1,4-alpha-glucan branching enzyme
MNLANLLTGISSSPNRHRRHDHHRSRHSRCVYLEFVHPQARRVCVAGSFNDWRPAVTPMIPMGRGWWVKGLALPPGRYEYRLVVDGQWLPDPNAAEATSTPDGGVNSVLVIPAEPSAAPPEETQAFPDNGSFSPREKEEENIATAA